MPAGDIIRRDGVIYRDNGDGTATVVGYEDQPQSGQVIRDPTAETRTLADQAALERALADVTRVQTQNEMDRREAALQDERRARGTLQSGMASNNVLDAIRNARRIAMQGGTGMESLASGIPATNARALQTELDTIIANLSFDRLQQMRDQSTTGGALGSITENELRLLGSTVGSLDTGVDLATFLRRLDKVERHFMGAQMAINGIDPRSPEGQQTFRDFGYTGVFEDENQQQGNSLASPNATQEAGSYPQELQNLHLQYLRDNWGNMDPDAYVRFRSSLDEQAGFTPDLRAYADAVGRWNELARQGGRPEQLGAVPAPNRDMGVIEQTINMGAQSAPGAFAANWANAATGGLPSALSGDQRSLDLLREARPYSSTLGELGGAITGAYGLGRIAPMLGINSRAADIGFNATYGATQDSENPLRGGLVGGVSGAGGSFLGDAIGGAFPATYARGAVNQADASVPTVKDLRDLASQQYLDVEARGVAAGPTETQNLLDRYNNILAREGRITPAGNLIDTDTPATRARQLVNDFAGQDMTPTQAQRVRSVIAEGAGSPDPSQRRLSTLLLQDFDQWADPVLPGISVPRQTAQRYLQGEQIGNLLDTSTARGLRQKGNDEGDAIRTAFGRLDEDVINGRARFDPVTSEQIARVARGDFLTNSLRNVGKFGAQNPVTMLGGGGAAGMAGNAVGGPVVGIGLGLTTALGGTLARNAAGNRTIRAAEEARLLALGGEDYQRAIMEAANQARRNASSIYSGLFGSGASSYSRQ